MPKKPDDLTYPVLVNLIQEIIENTDHYDVEADRAYVNDHMPKEKRFAKAVTAIFGQYYYEAEIGRKPINDEKLIEDIYEEIKSTGCSRSAAIKKHLYKAQTSKRDVDERNIIERLDNKLKIRIETFKANVELWGEDTLTVSNFQFENIMESEAYDEIYITILAKEKRK